MQEKLENSNANPESENSATTSDPENISGYDLI